MSFWQETFIAKHSLSIHPNLITQEGFTLELQKIIQSSATIPNSLLTKITQTT